MVIQIPLGLFLGVGGGFFLGLRVENGIWLGIIQVLRVASVVQRSPEEVNALVKQIDIAERFKVHDCLNDRPKRHDFLELYYYYSRKI